MTEPTRQEMLRALTALGPFVRRWGLPLNPEDMEELAYAVLRRATPRTVQRRPGHHHRRGG
jgi:hypothetical protein